MGSFVVSLLNEMELCSTEWKVAYKLVDTCIFFVSCFSGLSESSCMKRNLAFIISKLESSCYIGAVPMFYPS